MSPHATHPIDIIQQTLFYSQPYMKFELTMLQKLSKSEVKAWLSWNLIILPPLRFYVKPNFGKFKWSKNVVFGNFRDSELWILEKLALGKCFIKLNQSAGKMIKFQLSQALTSHFESFWSIVRVFYLKKVRKKWL